MKKIFLSLMLACTLIIFSSCSKQKDDETSTTSLSNSTTDAGVVINGVKWATRNVNTPGTFTTNTEDAGMFYQFDIEVGWPAIGNMSKITSTCGTTKWTNSNITSNLWEPANDPSPAGWRIPSGNEIEKLVDTLKVSSVWTTQNGVSGRKFTDKTNGNSVFFPACGYREGDLLGCLEYSGTACFYWGNSNCYEKSRAYSMVSFSSSCYCGGSGYTDGQSIRPVAK